MGSTNVISKVNADSRVSERSPLSTYDSVITLVVTLGIVLDWAPSYFLHINAGVYSFTKFVVTPLILLDMIVRLPTYLRSKAPFYGLIYLIAFLIGVGGGYTIGTISWQRFFELMPTVPILLFYLKRRTRAEVQLVLKYAFYASLLIPISLVLAKLGVLKPSQVEVLNVGGERMTRIWAGAESSTAGLYLLFPAVMLGGLTIRKKAGGASWLGDVVVGAVILLGLVGALLTGQRAAVILYALCLILSMVMNVRGGKNKRFAHLAVVLIILALSGFVLARQMKEVSGTSVHRIVTMNQQGGSNLTGRMAFYKTIYRDLTTRPQLIAPGDQEMRRKYGEGPHLILGEAYYDGGLLFMIVLFWGIVIGGVRSWKEWKADKRSGPIPTGGMLFLLWFGFFVYLSIDPGLHTRLVYVILGLCFGRETRHAARLISEKPARGAIPYAAK